MQNEPSDEELEKQKAYEEARDNMVKSQLVATGVQKHSIIERMGELERELFVPEEFKIIAYSAREIPVSNSRYMIDPMNLGLILDKVDFDSINKVMILGDSTGYVAALLADIIDDVVTVDNTKDFSKNITELLNNIKVTNVKVVEGDIQKGYPDSSPYDLIFINGSVQQIPDEIFSQLSPIGKILTSFKKAFISEAVFQSKVNNTTQTEKLFECSISLLPEFSKKSKFVF